MYYTVELVLKSYMHRHLEPGMWFITKLNPGTRKEYIEIWALDKTPLEPLEEFITKHGAPVEPYIIYDEQVLAEPEQIGWWDDGPEYEDLRDIELKDINLILEEYDGNIDIMIDDWDYAHEDEANPVLNADPITNIEKVTLCIPGSLLLCLVRPHTGASLVGASGKPSFLSSLGLVIKHSQGLLNIFWIMRI